MEFFEKAHCSKLSDNSKKDTKPDEKIKKQLKKMLYGYKKSDNELIKKSDNVDESDSASVSGFSDLNLSNACSDNETTKATMDSSDLDSVSNLIDSDEGSSHPVSISLSKDVGEDALSDSQSEKELSELINVNETVFTFGSSHIISSTDGSISDCEKSTLFDADGVLAQKINKRLNTGKVPQDKLKRKLVENKQSSINSGDQTEELKEPKTPKKINYNTITCDTMQFSDCVGIESNDHDRLSYTIDPTSNFVSITSKNTKTKQFDDIMGHYRNSTMKNISAERHNVSISPFKISDDGNDDEIQDEASISELGAKTNVGDSNLSGSIVSSEVQNESGNDDNTNQSEPNTEVDTSTEEVESLTEKYQIFTRNDCVIIVLKHPSDLYIHGKVVVRKLGGCAQLYGYNLGDEPCSVYAPYYNFAYNLQTLQGTNFHTGLFNKLTSQGVLIADAEEIVANLGTYDVVLAFEKLNNLKMDFIETNSNASNLFRKSIENIPLNLKRVSEKLRCTLYPEQPYKHFEENPNWQDAVRFGLSSCDPSRGIVCGGKGAGKSTFLRYYVNQQVSNGPILIVDLDPGQCEFTIAGCISATVVVDPLIGPNFTHLKKPNLMLNVGMISPMDNPKRYLYAVDQLITQCKADEIMSQIPWIVNTMGMCNGLGLKFMSYIILRTQPTFLLQIELQNMKKNYPFRLTPQRVEELHQHYKRDKFFAKLLSLDPLSYAYVVTRAETFRGKNSGSDSVVVAPKDERYLNLVAYFGELAHIHKTTTLLTITPFSVNLEDLFIATNIAVNKEAVIRVLHGKVVALCQQTDKTAQVFTLGDKPLLCYGHGLVRGYDKDIIYVLTPVATHDLALVNTILYTDWMPELRGLEKKLRAGTSVPYRMLSQYQQRQLLAAPRRRFNPLQLLRIARNP